LAFVDLKGTTVRTQAADGDRYPAIGRSIPFEGEPTNAPEGLLRLDFRLEMGRKRDLALWDGDRVTMCGRTVRIG
jgi:hypothetical protein